MNILLLVVAIILLASVFIGYKKGFLKIIASLVATLVCIVLVILISPHVSKWLQESTPLREIVQDKCIEMWVEGVATEEEAMQMEISRDQQITMIEGAEIPEMFRQMLLENNNNEVYAALGVNTFGQYIGAYIAKVVADILAFLITLIVVFILMKVVMGVLGIIDKLPLIGGVNRLAGGAVGIGVGILIIWIMFIVITLLYNTPIGAACLEDISESQILTKLYENNMLMNYITKF